MLPPCFSGQQNDFSLEVLRSYGYKLNRSLAEKARQIPVRGSRFLASAVGHPSRGLLAQEARREAGFSADTGPKCCWSPRCPAQGLSVVASVAPASGPGSVGPDRASSCSEPL